MPISAATGPGSCVTTLFCARHLLPIAAPWLEDGALLVIDGVIREAGRRADLIAAWPSARIVDFGNAVILPPMANVHTHLELTHFPTWIAATGQTIPRRSFVDWVLAVIHVRRGLDPCQLQGSVAAGLEQSLQAGTALLGDILSHLASRSAYAETAMSGRIFYEVLGRDPGQVASRLAEFEAALPVAPAPGLLWGLSPHAPYTLSEQTCRLAMDWARCHQLPVAMHLAETREETAFMAGRGGDIARRLYPAVNWTLPEAESEDPVSRSPVQWLLEQGLVPPGSLAIHGVHVATEEVADLTRSGLTIVLCPRSNALFGKRRAPLADYRQAGVPLALGTDSLASSPSLSLWDELAFAWSWYAGELSGADWLYIATSGGAAALGQATQFGRLTAGWPANFQVVSLPGLVAGPGVCDQLCAAGDLVRVDALYLAEGTTCENVLS